MSGGCYNYVCYGIQRFADSLKHNANTAKRELYLKILYDVANVAKEIEWADSFDTSQEKSEKALSDFFFKWKIPIENNNE